jgi:hypothetical protein
LLARARSKTARRVWISASEGGRRKALRARARAAVVAAALRSVPSAGGVLNQGLRVSEAGGLLGGRAWSRALLAISRYCSDWRGDRVLR